jgi:lycopene cyclase domain-containing protein
LFFVVVPYACVFIYACLNAYFPKWGSAKYGVGLARVLGPLLLIIGVWHYNHLYTLTAFAGCGALLLVLGYALKPQWLGRFFNAYFVALVPFFVVNGILTGTGIDDQVVWYNDAHNLGIRLSTIPLDDTIYNMLMLLMVVVVMEGFLKVASKT